MLGIVGVGSVARAAEQGCWSWRREEWTYRTKISRALLSESIVLKLKAASMVPLTRNLGEERGAVSASKNSLYTWNGKEGENKETQCGAVLYVFQPVLSDHSFDADATLRQTNLCQKRKFIRWSQKSRGTTTWGTPHIVNHTTTEGKVLDSSRAILDISIHILTTYISST